MTAKMMLNEIMLCQRILRLRWSREANAQRGESVRKGPDQQCADADRHQAKDEGVERSEQPVRAEAEADAAERR